MNLFEKIGNDEIKLEGSKKLKIVNEELNEIYKIPLKYLYYNDQNDRIATFVSEYESDNNIKIKDLDVESRNRVIEDFISKSDNDKFEKTKSDIFAKGQQETAFVLKDGRVFEFGRANEELEIAIFNKVEDMGNGLEADEYIILNDTSFMK